MIPSTFDNFTQRQLQRGIETKSLTVYKDYDIIMRAYNMSGIYYKISKVINNKRYFFKQENWNYYNPYDLLNRAKSYIDNHEDNILNKINNAK